MRSFISTVTTFVFNDNTRQSQKV